MMEATIEKLIAIYKSRGTSLSEEQAKEMLIDHQGRQEANAKIEQFQNEMRKKGMVWVTGKGWISNEEYARMQDEMQKAINELAESHGYENILDYVKSIVGGPTNER